VDWYLENEQYLDMSNFFWDLLRSIGLAIVRGLKMASDAAQKLFDDVYSFLSFSDSSIFQDWLDSYGDIISAVLVIAIIAFGFILMVNHEKRPNIVHGMLLYLVVLFGLPTAITKLNVIVYEGKNFIFDQDATTSAVIINNNVTDLRYVDKQNELSDLSIHYPVDDQLEDRIKYLDATETVSGSNNRFATLIMSETANEYFDHYITVLPDGNISLIEMPSKGWFDIFDPPWYYRYHIEWLSIYMELIAIIIAYVCAAYKVIRIIWEIIAGQLIATLFSADLTNPQKGVKILTCIRDNYIMLVLVAALLQLYNIAVTYVHSLDLGSFTKAFIILCLSFCVIDGPNLVEKMMGIDAGLSSGFQKLAAGYTMGRGAKNAVGGALWGNAMTGRKGLLNNKLANSLKKKGKDALNGLFLGGLFSGGNKEDNLNHGDANQAQINPFEDGKGKGNLDGTQDKDSTNEEKDKNNAPMDKGGKGNLEPSQKEKNGPEDRKKNGGLNPGNGFPEKGEARSEDSISGESKDKTLNPENGYYDQTSGYSNETSESAGARSVNQAGTGEGVGQEGQSRYQKQGEDIRRAMEGSEKPKTSRFAEKAEPLNSGFRRPDRKDSSSPKVNEGGSYQYDKDGNLHRTAGREDQLKK
jgi:hypothetical protein